MAVSSLGPIALSPMMAEPALIAAAGFQISAAELHLDTLFSTAQTDGTSIPKP
jgi:hypothetical protein